MELLGISPHGWVFVLFIVAVGAAVQATIGFGLPLVVVPVLALVYPEFVPGPVLVAALILALRMAGQGRARVDRRHLGQALVGLVLGTIAGAVGLLAVPPDHLPVAFAILILSAIGLSLLGFDLAITSRTLVAAGATSGLMGTMVGIHGPPIAMLYQRQPGPVARAHLASFFVLADSFALITLSLIGMLDLRRIALGLMLVPGIMLGEWLARPALRRIDHGPWLWRAVLGTAALSSIVLILQANAFTD